mmetsp:Transcript_36215/g.79138  ORF Transcript_36215/g.79138 Transcript_36215/m.79138 type:complete len:323 (-) Transcript_36215:1327-2295(-)
MIPEVSSVVEELVQEVVLATPNEGMEQKPPVEDAIPVHMACSKLNSHMHSCMLQCTRHVKVPHHNWQVICRVAHFVLCAKGCNEQFELRANLRIIAVGLTVGPGLATTRRIRCRSNRNCEEVRVHLGSNDGTEGTLAVAHDGDLVLVPVRLRVGFKQWHDKVRHHRQALISPAFTLHELGEDQHGTKCLGTVLLVSETHEINFAHFGPCVIGGPLSTIRRSCHVLVVTMQIDDDRARLLLRALSLGKDCEHVPSRTQLRHVACDFEGRRNSLASGLTIFTDLGSAQRVHNRHDVLHVAHLDHATAFLRVPSHRGIGANTLPS